MVPLPIHKTGENARKKHILPYINYYNITYTPKATDLSQIVEKDGAK
jgi:hypothetical protein